MIVDLKTKSNFFVKNYLLQNKKIFSLFYGDMVFHFVCACMCVWVCTYVCMRTLLWWWWWWWRELVRCCYLNARCTLIIVALDYDNNSVVHTYHLLLLSSRKKKWFWRLWYSHAAMWKKFIFSSIFSAYHVVSRCT